jgi:hypothetical protein
LVELRRGDDESRVRGVGERAADLSRDGDRERLKERDEERVRSWGEKKRGDQNINEH